MLCGRLARGVLPSLAERAAERGWVLSVCGNVTTGLQPTAWQVSDTRVDWSSGAARHVFTGQPAFAELKILCAKPCVLLCQG